jgi:hypothetical protein
MEQLSGDQRALLDFERRTFIGAGAKEQEIRATFGIGATTYFQRLNALLDREAALAYDPLLVNRLRRRRAANQRSRNARTPRSAGLGG